MRSERKEKTHWGRSVQLSAFPAGTRWILVRYGFLDLEFVGKGIIGRERDGGDVGWGMGDELTGGTDICSYRHGFDSLVAFRLHLTYIS